MLELVPEAICFSNAKWFCRSCNRVPIWFGKGFVYHMNFSHDGAFINEYYVGNISNSRFTFSLCLVHTNRRTNAIKKFIIYVKKP